MRLSETTLTWLEQNGAFGFEAGGKPRAAQRV